MSKYYGNDNFNLQNAYDDCKQVFEGITDEESYQKADCGVVMYYANEIMYALEKALEERPQGEWEHIPDDTNKQRIVYKCSVCGRIIDVYYREDLAYAYPFCHCGADMRKGGAE